MQKIKTVEVLGERCQIPDLPKKISYIPSIINHDLNLLLCGGQHNKNSCLRLDNGERWIHFNNLTQDRIIATSVTSKGASYIFGGRHSKMTSETMTIGFNKWEESWEVPEGSKGSCAVKISDQEILFIGGVSTSSRILQLNLVKEPKNAWKVLPIKLKQGRADMACAIFNSKVIITGGRDSDGISKTSTEILDLSTGNMTWKSGGDMTASRYRHGMGIITWKGKPTLVAFGGRVGNQKTYWSSVEAWDDSKGIWSLLPDFNLNEPKMAFGFATLPTELLCSDMAK